jgi:shikimate dehydrogenase
VKKIRARRSTKITTLPISGRTGITAVFGDPVAHSMSPAMHNAAYQALGIDRVYLACRVTPENLAAAIRSIEALGILGVNLTVPHKEAAARMLKNLSTEAKLLGAVNCVVNNRGKLRGDNTDARGLERDLRELKVNLREKSAIVIGAGGAATAAIFACARIGAEEIVVANRTQARANILVARMSEMLRAKMISRGLDALTDASIVSSAALVVNATPMGLTTKSFARFDYRATKPECFFHDTIYAAEMTPFIRPAAAIGRRHADGAGMLINQGELAFRLFNGIAPPSGVMRRVLMERLGRQ